MAKRRRNRRSSTAVSRWVLSPMTRRLALRMTALACALVLVWVLANAANQPIERIVVSGALTHVTATQVEDVVRAELRGAGLVTVNLGRISRALDALPWVDGAAVQRSWPRGLTIQITEQIAIARWNAAGLLNARGELFLAHTTLARLDLPLLAGPEGAEQEVTARYLSMQQQLQGLGLALNALTLDERGAWNCVLADGVAVRLGRSDVDARFNRFVLAAAALVRARAADIAYVDMRYGNGFAVGWRGSQQPNAQPLASTGDHSHSNG
jgi:cell division protein FtsQ